MTPKKLLSALALVTATLAQAQPLPTAAPESVGMSSERLNNIEAFFARRTPRFPGGD